MNSSKIKISLDLASASSQVLIPLYQGDTERVLEFSFNENGKPYKISDCDVAFTAKKPDGTYMNCPCVINANNNTATFDVGYHTETDDHRQLTAVLGMVDCQLVISKNTKRIASPYFNVSVLKTAYNGEEVINSETTLGILENLYVPLVRTVAGLKLDKNRSAKELQEALSVYPILIRAGAPDTSTYGNANQLLIDIVNRVIWICRGAADNEETGLIEYIWRDICTGQGQGANGKSAYEIALDNGFEGTESEWLESLQGEDGTSVADSIIVEDDGNGNVSISWSEYENGNEVAY